MARMPQVTSQDLVRFLKSQGFVEDRQSGSHLTLWHEARNVSVTIPVHTGCDLGRGGHNKRLPLALYDPMVLLLRFASGRRSFFFPL